MLLRIGKIGITAKMKTELTLRWVARILSLFFAGLYAVFVIGEGLPPLFSPSMAALQSWFLVLTFLALLAGWRYELWGGIVGLCGIAGFYFTNFVASGFRQFPGGWVFPMIAIIPACYLMAQWWRSKRTKSV